MHPANKERAKKKFKKLVNSAPARSYNPNYLNQYFEELNRFNKSKFTDFIHRCGCEWCSNGKQKKVLTHKDIFKEQLLDFQK